MKKRLAVVTAGLLAGLMALGTANALVLDTTPGSETTANEQAVVGVETTYEVGDAGTVTLANDGAQLDIVSVDQNDGWQIEIEVATGREVEVDFRNGTRRIQFNAELEDGEIRVRARERVTTATAQATTSTTQGSTASTVAASEQTGTITYEAGAAGSVTISSDGSQLTIVDVTAADGWSHEIEVQVGREVEMDFRNGEERVQFNAEFEDGEVRVRVRTRTADGTRTEVTNGVDTTADDSSSNGGSSDDGVEDSDDDNSGRGDSSDDHDDDRDDHQDQDDHADDNGGRGSSSDDDDSSDD
jgi:hypothetical protein